MVRIWCIIDFSRVKRNKEKKESELYFKQEAKILYKRNA